MEVAIVFASMTGNTEEIAEIIESKIDSLNVSVTALQIDFDDIEASDLTRYDAILLGTYTWGDGDLPFEIEDFYDDLEDVDLTGKKVALFGSCDSFYPEYGTAIDTMGERFKSIGAEVVLDYLKVDLAPELEDVKRCEDFAEAFVDKLNN
ncbi:flavodoxin [Paraliobacillus quinghaiensis]|uniref:Flavodoxin n=1 Tax=Paraliobacillus quinghaiensis TaxID=470815 RepID=A0A917TRJ8_9BACI|nr:flavodoxin [Paraliobacillus quinghaiensis]GGM33694.1 flavodoxin [Paraliobacillus quinghaiensis]